MPTRLQRQAARFHASFAELVRAYQFRDRESICCHGLSITQCYALEALERLGPLSMGRLAEHMRVELSTMTRAIDPLVARGLAERREGAADRRVREVHITPAGSALVATIHSGLVAEYEEVLRRVPPASREAVVEAIGHLLEAFRERGACGAGQEAAARRGGA